MAKSSIPSADEALAGMARTGAPRKPMGNGAITSARNASADSAGRTLRPKGNANAGDPTIMDNPQRGQVKAETLGASYHITAMYAAPLMPEAGSVTANGRLFASATNRTRPNFDGGVAASM